MITCCPQNVNKLLIYGLLEMIIITINLIYLWENTVLELVGVVMLRL